MFLPQMWAPFENLSWWLVGLPVVLAVLDGVYKRAIFKHAPYDGVADIALAALTFTAVHLISKATIPSSAVWVVVLQFAAWPLALGWGLYLRDTKSGVGIGFSYAVGILWFIYTVGWLLLLVPA